jgi:iron complex outermembrane recepter protein
MNTQRLQKAILLSSAAMAFAVASAYAQEAAKPSEDVVVVTGSRISSRGFTQPTPTTTLDSAEIAKVAQPNIFNAIIELPALQGSTGRATSVGSTSSGIQGLSSLSLRGLGPIRTLTLIDGQRVVGANVTGVTDVSQFPQLLIKRADVVTGGASASYGSDAMGGVVNFITDKTFEGFKMNIEAGQTTYGDDKNYTYQAAWGRSFLDNRLHVQLSGERGTEDGVPAYGFGAGAGPNGRDWFKSTALQQRPISATTDGLPQLRYITNAQNYQYAKYGLITSGPLQGTAFGANGVPYQFQYGSNGVPTGTGAVTNCFSPFCVGGDLEGVVGNGTSYAGALDRTIAYGRVAYDLSENHHVFATVNIASVKAANTVNPGAAKNANLTIQCENPYVPASIKAACVTNNITSFQYGTANAEFPNFINVHPVRRQYRYVVGAEGNFDTFGTKWSYDTYYQLGINYTDLVVRDISLTPRYNAAIDAIALADGSIVCRSIVARNSGCQPLNIIGNVTPSTGALAYILPAKGPQQHTRSTQDVFSFNLKAEPFSLWAGPVALATGFEYRKEAYVVRADAYGNGVTADSPNNADYPVDPLMNTAIGNNWYAGNYHNASGSYDVKEAYVEVNIPVLNSDSWGTANLNLADRETKYSTAGKVNTWKVGANWNTKIDGVRLRAVTSRDIRAPNLSELYAAETVFNNVVSYNNNTITVLQRNIGNPNLRPEIARNTELGVVLNHPTWLPGLSASVDFYKIRVDDVISTLGVQQEVDLCVAGNQEICSAMLLTSTVPNTNFVRVQAFNLASLDLKGYDIEVAYRTGLSKIHVPGTLTVRALATHTIDYITNPGVIGTIPSEGAGVNTGSTPNWKVLFTQSWDTQKANLNLSQRWISDGVFSNEYIECQTGCPVSTTLHQTIDNNLMKGALYVDFGGSYKVTSHMTAFFKIDNLLDQAPTPTAFTNVGYGINPVLYDALGRMYRAGARFSF